MFPSTRRMRGNPSEHSRRSHKEAKDFLNRTETHRKRKKNVRNQYGTIIFYLIPHIQQTKGVVVKGGIFLFCTSQKTQFTFAEVSLLC